MDLRSSGAGRAVKAGSPAEVLRHRAGLKRAGGSAILDTGLPRRWGVVSAPEGDPHDYGSVLGLLRDECLNDGGLHPFVGGQARPLTFKEIVQARLDQFRQDGKIGSLWDIWLDSCSAIVYDGAGSFKVMLLSPQLLDVQRPMTAPFLSVDFNEIPGNPLQIDDSYDRGLSFDEVLKHKGWLAVLEDDKDLLKEYATVVFEQRGCGKAMRFWTPSDTVSGELRALCADELYEYCGCYGCGDLRYGTNFARVFPR